MFTALAALWFPSTGCRSKSTLFETRSPDGKYLLAVEEGTLDGFSEVYTFVSLRGPSGWQRLIGEELGMASVLFGLTSWSPDSKRVTVLLCTNAAGTIAATFEPRGDHIVRGEPTSKELEAAIIKNYGADIINFPKDCPKVCWICSHEAWKAFRRRTGLRISQTSAANVEPWYFRVDLNKLCQTAGGCEGKGLPVRPRHENK